jgi:hypothetical protein
MLIAHFQIPARVPGDNSPPATITQFVLHHHAAILATAWLQGFGPFPYVLFALGVVYLAGAMTRLAGWVTLLASAVILTLSLIDAAFTISAAEAVTHGHAVTASVSFDLIDGPGNDAVGRVFLIAPPAATTRRGTTRLPAPAAGLRLLCGRLRRGQHHLGPGGAGQRHRFQPRDHPHHRRERLGPRRRGRPGDLTETGILRASALPTAASGHRLARQRLPAALTEPAIHLLTSAPKARPHAP